MVSFNSNPGDVIAIDTDVYNGNPRLLLIVRKDAVTDVLLNGAPAIAIPLGESAPNANNGAWELGHLICDKWTEAEKKAGRKPVE